MWNYLIGLIAPTLLLICGFCLPLAVLYPWLRYVKLRMRRNPLTRDLLHPPGESVRQKLEDLNVKLTGIFAMLGVLPMYIFASHISLSYVGKLPESWLRSLGWIVVGAGIFSGMAWKLWNLLSEIRKYRMALHGELAVGEELNQLMLLGFRVFHDMEYPYGNLDHVVVAPSGVYVINTKMRGKSGSGSENAKAIVDYYSATIRFPDGEFPLPIAQMEREQKWLTQFLTESTGSTVDVHPMIAYPGWYIERNMRRETITVFNPRNAERFFQGPQVLSPAQVRQCAFQLEQRCRRMEVVSSPQNSK